jgi:hypothetical protein
MSVKVEVKVCEQCPFFSRGVISAIADALAKDNRKTGMCQYRQRVNGGFLAWGATFHIAEPAHAPPSNCPLRSGETIVKLASGV